MCGRSQCTHSIQNNRFCLLLLVARVCVSSYCYTHSLIRDRSHWGIYHQSYYYKHNFKYNEIYDINTPCTAHIWLDAHVICIIYAWPDERFMMMCQIDQQRSNVVMQSTFLILCFIDMASIKLIDFKFNFFLYRKCM